MRSSLAFSIGIVLALVGCQSGCDGERQQHPQPPRPPEPIVPSDAGIAIIAAQDAEEIPKTLGFLDAPPGTLDGLFTGRVGAGSQGPGGRVLMLLFGDSHAAGASMTARLRATWQGRFGDAGRGLVAAGKPPTK